MKRMLQAFFLASLLIGGTSVSVAQRDQQETKPPEEKLASLSGRVLLGATPMPKALVGLYAEYNTWLNGPVYKTNADIQGNFRLTGVRAGTYRLAAIYPGLSSEGEARTPFLGRVITVDDGEVIENLDVP